MGKSSDPIVTIGIPTYNRAEGYFKQALTSALSQTYQNIDIVVADNCSTDNTERYVKSIPDSRIRYFKHSKNLAPNDNFNFCLKEARGEYFLLLHDDDLIDDDFVETCINGLPANGEVGIIRTGTRTIDGNGSVLNEGYNRTDGLSTTDFILTWFKWKTAFYFCSLLFNTKRLKEIGGFGSKTNLFQDVVAAVQLAAKFGRVDIYDIKASFRKHGSGMTFANKINDWVEDSIYLLDLICDLIPEDMHLLKKEGLAYFSMFNYLLATKINSPASRLLTYFNLFKTFKLVFVRQILVQLIHRTPIYPALQSLRKNLKTFS